MRHLKVRGTLAWVSTVLLSAALSYALDTTKPTADDAGAHGKSSAQKSVDPTLVPSSAGAAPPLVIVVGFVGGFVKQDNLVHPEVQLAAQLRRDYSSGVYAAVFQNRNGAKALAAIQLLLDTNHDGILSAKEKQNARIILYGHSWGASETIALARQLQRDNIPVLLTVQVDSIAKRGEEDATIPANVAEAINFYQPNGFLHGQPDIRPVNPARTKIIGNFRMSYKSHPVDCEHYPWFARTFMKPHIEIENDRRVWDRVDSLIRAELPPPNQAVALSPRIP